MVQQLVSEALLLWIESGPTAGFIGFAPMDRVVQQLVS